MSDRNKIIYVSGPYTAPTRERIHENIQAAATVARRVWMAGYTALCPHLNTMYFEDLPEVSYEDIMQGDLELVDRSDALIMVDGWTRSKGAVREMIRARSQDKPTFLTLDALITFDWSKKYKG